MGTPQKNRGPRPGASLISSQRWIRKQRNEIESLDYIDVDGLSCFIMVIFHSNLWHTTVPEGIPKSLMKYDSQYLESLYYKTRVFFDSIIFVFTKIDPDDIPWENPKILCRNVCWLNHVNSINLTPGLFIWGVIILIADGITGGTPNKEYNQARTLLLIAVYQSSIPRILHVFIRNSR
jgi:hypothetical protein